MLSDVLRGRRGQSVCLADMAWAWDVDHTTSRQDYQNRRLRLIKHDQGHWDDLREEHASLVLRLRAAEHRIDALEATVAKATHDLERWKDVATALSSAVQTLEASISAGGVQVVGSPEATKSSELPEQQTVGAPEATAAAQLPDREWLVI